MRHFTPELQLPQPFDRGQTPFPPPETPHKDFSAGIEQVLARLGQVEAMLALLVEQRTVRDWYSTAAAASLLHKAEFTVREWCRLRRVHAEKRQCGRGLSQEWMISREEILRIQNEGLLPQPKY